MRRATGVLLLGLAALPHAAAGRMAVPNVRLRMEGYVGPPPEGRREMADLILQVDKANLRFQVTKATVLSGDRLASNVFDRVAPYKPNFILRGPKELLARVKDAPPRAPLVITGQWITRSRDFMVAAVEPGKPAPGS